MSLPALAAAADAVPPPGAVLFRDVHVVSMTRPQADLHRDVLVGEDGRIARIAAAGTLEAPPGGTVVEGRGRYLMPGLAEMHAHVPGPRQRDYAYDVLLLYVAHGVTTIRGMLGDPWHLELRGELARHERLGPRFYTSGPSFNGRTVPDAARGVTLVREQAAAGYDFLKLHPGLSRAAFDAIAATAREADITFQGHVSADVGLLHALDARQRAIDHLDGYVEALVSGECPGGRPGAGFFGIGVAHCADAARIPDLVRRTRAAGTWMVPTQILIEQWAAPPSEESLLARPAVRYVPQEVLSRWLERRSSLLAAEGVTPERARRLVELRRRLIRELHAEGVPIALGSDAPQVFNVPGDSALAELELYVEIGLSPYEALRTATTEPARFFGASDRFGDVREGLEADLVLVEGDPLADIRAVRRRAGVMARGRWLPRETLDARLEALAARLARPQGAAPAEPPPEKRRPAGGERRSGGPPRPAAAAGG